MVCKTVVKFSSLDKGEQGKNDRKKGLSKRKLTTSGY